MDSETNVPELNREAWLALAATRLVEHVLAPEGYVHQVEAPVDEAGCKRLLLDQLRVSCSWPSRGALSLRKRVIGQCWAQAQSADGSTELFISPVLATAEEVLPVLVHELLHAAVGCAHGHDRRFSRACIAVGLEGKPTATVAGEELTATLALLASNMPPYPHAKLDFTKLSKKQGTRMLKVYCGNPECSAALEDERGDPFTFRTTRKWIDRYRGISDVNNGPCIIVSCPDCGHYMFVEEK